MSITSKTNRLSIYLIKTEFDNPESILKDINSSSSLSFDENGTSTLYTKDSFDHPPQWIEKFFLKSAEDFNLNNSSSQAILLVKIKTDDITSRHFAIPFGVGHHMLKSGVIEERFGLKVVLNTVDENQLKSICKQNMTNVPKQSTEQISRNSIIADFGIDIEQDLVLGVTGKSKDEEYGKTITGRDPLNVSVKVDINTIKDFLKKCYEQYNKVDYKTNFGWIDQIAEIKSSSLIKKLNEGIIEKAKQKDFEKLWMAIPEIIDWDDVEGFNYSYANDTEKYDDIFIQSYLAGLFPDDDYSHLLIDTFTKNDVLCYSSTTETIKYQWKAFNCLYCEIEKENDTYLLTNGKWYKIETNFVKQINDEYQGILKKECLLNLPEYSHKNEGDYNNSVANESSDIFLMDKKDIPYGGGYSRVEFCDLFTLNKELIHIKIYGGSSVLSHLFNQGLVSGELFKAEKDFRDQVNNKFPDKFKLKDTKTINTSDYKVIYAIISYVDKDLDIPFFSKVSLKNAKKRLETIGYNVYLIKVPVQKNKGK